jgi:hypothetical protein
MTNSQRPERAAKAWAKRTADKYITRKGNEPPPSKAKRGLLADIEAVDSFLKKWTSKQATEASAAFKRVANKALGED